MRSYRSLAVSILLLTVRTSSGFTLPQSHHAAAVRSQLYSESSKPTAGMETDESMEYEYNEADFADYSSDYSDVDDDDIDDIDLDDIDLGDIDLDEDDIDEYSNLSPFEKHAREVFLTFAEQVQSTIDHDSDNLASSTTNDEKSQLKNAAILMKGFIQLLKTLDIEATEEESKTLFKYLDVDEGGSVSLDEFLPWYAEAIDAAQQTALSFQKLVTSRRTINKFDATEVDNGVLRRALECAIAAPNRSNTEPWRFISLGKKTVGKITELRERIGGEGSFVSWTKVPHWIVVTYRKSPPDSGPDGKMQQREDFKSTCCAVQNFLLSMWSEGIGTKWTDGPIQRTEEFANICGVDLEKEKVAGVIWYGFARGGLNKAQAKWRKKGVEEVLDVLP